jgi:hypothetical protein
MIPRTRHMSVTILAASVFILGLTVTGMSFHAGSNQPARA